MWYKIILEEWKCMKLRPSGGNMQTSITNANIEFFQLSDSSSISLPLLISPSTKSKRMEMEFDLNCWWKHQNYSRKPALTHTFIRRLQLHMLWNLYLTTTITTKAFIFFSCNSNSPFYDASILSLHARGFFLPYSIYSQYVVSPVYLLNASVCTVV